MARVMPAEVLAICPTSAPVEEFIKTAHIRMRRLENYYEEDELKEMEKYLAAHLVRVTIDREVLRESRGAAEVTYTGDSAMGLQATGYGQTFLELDYRGILGRDGRKMATWEVV